MQKAIGFDVQVAHKPATFYLILVHKAKKSKSMIHFGPMCGVLRYLYPFKGKKNRPPILGYDIDVNSRRVKFADSDF